MYCNLSERLRRLKVKNNGDLALSGLAALLIFFSISGPGGVPGYHVIDK